MPERYESFDELLNLALENQLRLEEHGISGPLEAGNGGPVEPPTADVPAAPIEAGQDDPFAAVRALEPAQFSSVGEPVDPSEWSMPLLWGQVNRLLPTIAGVRVLGHLLVSAGTSQITLGRWHEDAAATAAELHDVLVTLDHQADRRRGDLWSIGFPRQDRSSMRRYGNQFLGRGSFRAPGAAEMIGLVSIDAGGDEAVVAMTQAGIDLCSLPNPVFDSEDEPEETISEEEASLYLQILDRQLPGERKFMGLMAELIEATPSRTALEEALVECMPELEKYGSTMRAGGIGRLHDLGFLDRTREGTSVRYSLGQRARDLGLIS